MKKEWLLVAMVIGLAAFLNGCCKKQVCPSCTAAPSAQQGIQAFDAGQMGSASSSRAIK